ncbi:MAG: CD1247 N-terminal domain-containing protein [Thermacetogeniaceae bacterium]
MEDLRERIAYLQGLAEGLKLEEGREEAKVIKQIIDILADLIDEVEELRAAQEDLEDYLDSIDEELFGDEEDFEEEDEEEDDNTSSEDECDDECEEDYEDEIEYVEVECPKCHDIVCFDADIVDEEEIIEVTCPNCNEVVYVNDGSMPPPQRAGKAAKLTKCSDNEEDL